MGQQYRPSAQTAQRTQKRRQGRFSSADPCLFERGYSRSGGLLSAYKPSKSKVVSTSGRSCQRAAISSSQLTAAVPHSREMLEASCSNASFAALTSLRPTRVRCGGG